LSKTLVLIDGFNYYHRLDTYCDYKKINLKWLNYKKLIQHYLKNEDVEKLDVVYYSALANHRPKESVLRHKTYIKALESEGIEIVLGQFKEKYAIRCKSKEKCSNCKCTPDKTKLLRHEEKNTDVNIAIRLIEASIAHLYDKCFLLSSDNDFSSAIRRARELNPNFQIIICPPPDGNCDYPKKSKIRVKDLENSCGCKALIINWKRIKESQFPDEFNGIKNPWL